MTISTFMEREELKFDVYGNRAFSFALNLLKDDDPDIVLQAVQVLDHLKDPRALETLRFLLYHSDPNVVQAAIPEIVPAVLDLYLRVPIAYRYLLNPLLLIYKKQMRSLLIDLDANDETRLVISAYLGIYPICIALEIIDLPQDSRIMVISQITDCKTILKCLPWSQWLENNPVLYASIAEKLPLRRI